MSDSSDGGRPTPPNIGKQLRKRRVFSKLFGTPVEKPRIGRFTIEEQIGSGGMGQVYKAHDDKLKRSVAIKLVKPDNRSVPRVEQRMLREAETLASVSHPNVVEVFEVGIHDGQVFIVMELVEGETLLEELERDKRPPTGQQRARLLRLLIQAGRGLEAAHEKGLMHRDFKPANVIIDGRGHARVLDFGLAKETSLGTGTTGDSEASAVVVEDAANTDPGGKASHDQADNLTTEENSKVVVGLTTVGRIQGTPGYMSPEQMQGMKTDHRSDQYSFCVSLYEALYGTRPYPHKQIARLRAAVVDGEPRQQVRGARVPRALRKVIDRGLSPRVEDRYPDMAALLAELESWLNRWRRYLTVAFVASIFLVATVTYAVTKNLPEQPDPCDTPGLQWGVAEAQGLTNALLQAGVASATANRVTAGLTSHARAWKAVHEQTCEMTYQQRLKSEADFAAVSRCLDDDRYRFNAVVAVLQDSERQDAPALNAPNILKDPQICTGEKTVAFVEKGPLVTERKNELINVAIELALGNPDRAERIAREVLERYTQSGLDAPKLQAEILYELGGALTRQPDSDKVKEGEGLLEQAMGLLSRFPHSRLEYNIVRRLARSANINHASAKSSLPWEDIASRIEVRVGDARRVVARSTEILGVGSMSRGKFAEAEEQFTTSWSLVKADDKVSVVDKAVYLQEQGRARQRLGKPENAIPSYEQAIELLEATESGYPARVAAIRQDLASAYLVQGKLDKALEQSSEALQVFGEYYGPDHRHTALAYVDLAEIERQLRKLQEAQTHLDRALEIYTRKYPGYHAELARIQNTRGAVAYTLGELETAIVAYQAALQHHEEHPPPNEFHIGEIQANLAEALIKLERYTEAKPHLDEAERLLAPVVAGNLVFKTFLLGLRARMHVGAGEYRQAVKPATAALKIYEEQLKGDSLEKAEACWTLAQALYEAVPEQRPNALERALQAQEIFRDKNDATAQAIAKWLASRR